MERNLNLKIPKTVTFKEAKIFFDKIGLKKITEQSLKKKLSTKAIINQKTPIKPDLIDLYRIYQFIVLNKRTTVLEFGCGWSSVIIMTALNNLYKKFYKQIKNLRRKHPFELFILDTEKKFLKLSKKKIDFFCKVRRKYSLTHSKSKMTTFNGRICTEYEKLPLVNPDFIYLDGPGQEYSTRSNSGINVKHQDFMPMSSDILKIENFLIPGTIILIDGRTINARFLKNNFQRNWKYIHDKKNDQIFFLNEESLGHVNTAQLNFYASKKN